MNQWHAWLENALHGGSPRPDRTGVGTLSLFGLRTQFDLSTGLFPAVTTKHLYFGQVKAELAAFIRGAETLDEFHEVGCNIWDGNGTSEYWKPRMRRTGDLGRIYGVQWRRWRAAKIDDYGSAYDGTYTDQLMNLVNSLREDPFGRRHLVTAWNPGELDQMCLPPCHYAFQAYCEADDIVHDEIVNPRLSLMVHMRSLDLFLGMPFDVASYALLMHLIARELGWGLGKLILTAGDAHIYKNHVEQVREVLVRDPLPLPKLVLAPEARLFDFYPYQAELDGYHSLGAIQAPLNI